jgi:ferredoxin
MRRGSRWEAGAISLSDPTIVLTLITVVLWLAVISWKLQRKGQANGSSYDGTRRAEYTPRRAGYEPDGYEPDDDGGYQPRRALKTPRIPAQYRGVGAEVEINPGKCARFAFCEHEAPEIFRLEGDRIGYKPQVPPDQVDKVAMAVKVCPARAIKMKLPGSKPYLPQPDVDDDERRPIRR